MTEILQRFPQIGESKKNMLTKMAEIFCELTEENAEKTVMFSECMLTAQRIVSKAVT